MNNLGIIYIIGFHATGFAIFHAFFWKLFRWKTGLNQVSKPNKAILQIANIQLIYTFTAIAILCFVFSSQLFTTDLGRFILLSISVFWLVRLIQQFIFLRINHWMVHALSVLFALGAVLAALPLFNN